MAYKLVFSKNVITTLDELPHSIAQRIIKKLEFYCQTNNPLAFAKPLKGINNGEYRFRVGDYRIIFLLHNNTVSVIAIGHRRNIYV